MAHTRDMADKYAAGATIAIRSVMPFYNHIEGTKCLVYAAIASIESALTYEKREELLKFLAEAHEYIREEIAKEIAKERDKDYV